MIILHAVLLFSVLSPLLSAPDLSSAIARINEARARSVANRARVRAHTARLTNRLHSSAAPSRSKRQVPEGYPGFPQPPPPVYYDEPELVHICSLEDDDEGYARSAEQHLQEFRESSAEQKRFHFPRVISPRANEGVGTRKSLSVDGSAKGPGPNGNQLDIALDDLHEVKKILNNFEEAHGRHSEPDFQIHDKKASSQIRLDPPHSMLEKMRSSFQEQQKLQENRDAEAHSHSHNRFHQRIYSHGSILPSFGVPIAGPVPQTHITAGGFVPQAHVTTSGFHLPQTQVITPGLNLNVNQNQNLNSGLNPPPLHGLVSAHTQPIFHSRQSGDLHMGKEAEAEADPHFPSGGGHHGGQQQSNFGHHGRPNHHNGFNQNFRPGSHNNNNNFHQVNHNQRPSNWNHGGNRGQFHKHRSGEFTEATDDEKIEQTEQRAGTVESVDEDSGHFEILDREAKPTIKKLKQKLKGQYYQPYPNYHYGTSGRYRDNEDDDSDDDFDDEDDAREANPTIKKLKKLKSQKYYQPYPSYQAPQYYGQRYREAEDEEVGQHFQNAPLEQEVREANPNLKKLKEKLMPPYHQPYPSYPQAHYYYGGLYRDAEENRLESPQRKDSGADTEAEEVSGVLENDPVEGEEAREANPTIKKLKELKKMKSYQPYPSYQAPQYYGRYREAEDEEVGQHFESAPLEEEEARQANPNLEKLKEKLMPRYHQPYPTYPQSHYYYRDAEESHQRKESFPDEPLSSPYLFDVPVRRFSDQYKRSIGTELDTILGTQRQIVDSLKEKSGNDEDLKFVTDVGNRTLTTIEDQRRKIVKRSLPLTHLISDPTAKLDVPQTIENFGTATKNAFEDERAPMYHFKHLVGSSKNALLSAMKIAPHNMIIPSDYDIVKSSHRVGAVRARPDQDDRFGNTFKRVGQIVRESIRSGQDTAAHIGEAAHSARNILNTARHAAPRLIIPYSQIPAIQGTQKKRPHKAILITPRLVDLAHETPEKKSAAETRSNYIRLGHLMDAVGLSKPESKSLELQKIIFEPHGIHAARVNERLADLYSRFKDRYEDDVGTVGEAISTLEDAKISVGAQNLRDLLIKMRSQLTDTDHHKKKYKSKDMKQEETKQMGRFIETLFDGTKTRKKEDNHEPKEDPTVGAMMLPQELMHPFMGRASVNDLRNFLRDNGDKGMDKMENAIEYQRSAVKPPQTHFQESGHHHSQNNSNLGYVLGAINPMMFERLYNETVTVRSNQVPNPDHSLDGAPEDNATVGTFFTLNEPMMKPFMGQAPEREVEKFLDGYNRDDGPDSLEMEE